MNINQIVQDEIKKIDVEKIFKDTLSKQIEETIKKSLKDSLGSYSAFSKSFDDIVEKHLSIDPDRITLPQYNDFVVSQAVEVIQGLMSKDRAAAIKKVLVEKLAPHIAKEIEFSQLVDAIKESLLDTYDDGDCCDRSKYLIECVRENKSYGSGPYYELAVYEGEKKSYDSVLAKLYVMDGKCYHHSGKRGDPFAKRFASYAFNGTMITDIKEVEMEVTYQDKFE